MIADALHSFSDLISDILILVINRFSHNDPDENHPYGHARFETLGTVLLGSILLIVGISMGYEYGSDLINTTSDVQPSWFSLAIVFISLLCKEWQYRFTLVAAKKIRSPLLEANAWHHRSDAFSSLVVFIGVLSTLAGYPIVETIAALFVAVLISKMGFSLAWDAIQQLVDHGISAELKNEISKTLSSIPGVRNTHMLRGRLMSNHIFIDAHIQVASDISVSEGHQIGDWAMRKLRASQQDVQDITLHVDYEADNVSESPTLAPLRPEIESALKNYPALSHYDDLIIHFYQQKVHTVLIFNEFDECIYEEAERAIEEISWLDSIRILKQIRTYGP
ncbi:putative Co/Zn/Cd cation transporter [Gynuella sunshinyii YC6258]|uniref:Putative Co/Zn/Cd cation transporter n=1 Tax=Gynuella sunshinyii YC6258 TaxID=1445510 RepID=A0A0C5VP66_9GAMM|nr:putative Co/Zn/Cd cation transporter [Gynuella sunshinyii YC6258]